jgi:hypothetical protein
MDEAGGMALKGIQRLRLAAWRWQITGGRESRALRGNRGWKGDSVAGTGSGARMAGALFILQGGGMAP